MITDYFKATKALKPLGHPKKRKQKNNHATADVDIPIEMRKSPPEELFTAKPEINSPPDALCTKQKIINWGKPGPNHDKMLRTIDHWLNDGDDRFDTNGERFKDYRTYAHSCGIPPMSLYRYIHPDALKRLQLGDGSRGEEKLLTDEEVLFMGHVMARQDHVNDGLMRKEAKDIIVDVSKQDITFRAAGLQLSRCVRPVNVENKILKLTLQMPQATTSDRTNINIAQQYRWHRLVDAEYDNLRMVDIGLCKKSGKTFGEVMSHFIVGLDEMCIMSDFHGNAHVFVSADKKKHAKILQDSRIHITIVRTGTVAGTTGPTIFVLKGTQSRSAY